MIHFVLYCALFACGIIAACVDWNAFFNILFQFDQQIEITKPIFNKNNGLPTGRTE